MANGLSIQGRNRRFESDPGAFIMPTKKFNISDKRLKVLYDAIRDGSFNNTAIKAAGIARSSFYYWKKTAIELARDVDAGIVKKSKLRADETRLLDFLDSLIDAETHFELSNLRIIREAAEGGQTFTEKHVESVEHWDAKSGQVITLTKKRVVERVMLPDWKAAAFRIQRRLSKRWGRETIDLNLSLKDAARKAGIQPDEFERGYSGLLKEVTASIAQAGANGSLRGGEKKS